MKRIAINGFGRIGRLTFRLLMEKNDIEVVAINDLTDSKTLAHLLKYDSAQGIWNKLITVDAEGFTIEGKKIKVMAIKNPLELPWKDLKIDVVIESTGSFTDSEKAKMHLQAGAERVLISAPAKGNVQAIVLGVNDEKISDNSRIYSNASCTTNCLAPLVKVLDQNFGFKEGIMVTAHAYTADQNLQDAPHRDLRRARAAAVNIVPTTSGAAEAVAEVYPQVKGKLTGKAYRVPVITGSIVDLTCLLNKKVSEEEINAVFQNAASTDFKNIISYNTDPLVSSDIIGNPHSAIFDAPLTKVIGDIVNISAWYDNEAGYSNRLTELVGKIAELPDPID